jgi:hypothetical protein
MTARRITVDAAMVEVLLAAVTAPGCNAGTVVADPDMLQEAIDELGTAAALADTPDPTAQLAWTAAAAQVRQFTATDTALNTEGADEIAWLRTELLVPYFERFGLDPADGRSAVGALAALLAALAYADLRRAHEPSWAEPCFDRHLAHVVHPIALAITRAAPAEVRTP